MSVYFVTTNYSFSSAKVQLFLKMVSFFGFWRFGDEKGGFGNSPNCVVFSIYFISSPPSARTFVLHHQ